MGTESFFGDQAERLLRTSWGNDADALAQELFAMFTAQQPINLQGPVTITRAGNNTEPALEIDDGTNGSTSPIIINKSGDPYSCCGSGSGPGAIGGSGVSGGGNTPPKPPDQGFQPPPVTPVNPAPPGTRDPNTPYKQFVGTVTIKINQGDPDPFHWNGLDVIFSAIGCFPYKPPTVPAPSNAHDERFNQPNGTIDDQEAAFLVKWGLDGFTETSNTVSAPGGTC